MPNFLLFGCLALGLIHFSKGTFCPNGVFSIIPWKCPDTCARIFLQKDCTEANKVASHCKCDDGYILGSNDNCQLVETCLKSKCKQNAIFRRIPCSKYCKDILTNKNCTVGTPPGCACLPGYYIGKDRNCVSESQCYKELNVCGNGVYDARPCRRTCKNMFTSTTCSISLTPGCKCDEGYFLNSTGVCVPPKNCDEVNCVDANSAFAPTSCVKTCKNLLYGEPCTPSEVPKCACKSGFYLSQKGVCVAEAECKLEDPCQPNASTSLEPCNLQCKNYFSTMPCVKGTTPGCQCNGGLYQTSEGNCVEPKSCTGVTCEPNSIFTSTSCEHTCKSHLLNEECVLQEVLKCSCLKGFYRNSLGECDTEANCKLDAGVCPENSEYADLPCSKTCRNMFGAGCTPESSPGCQCKNGYFQNAEGDCVRGDQCVGVQCDPNSTFKLTSCEHTCKTILYSEACIPVTKPTCACDDGFARNSAMDCVSRDNCKTDTGICTENSSFEEDIKCLNTCENMYGLGICKPQTPGCQCDDGYYMKKDGTCVKDAECDEVTCKPNSIFTNTSCEHSCKSHLLKGECVQQEGAKCSCVEGYYRNSAGECDTEANCKLDIGVCPENSEYADMPCSKTCRNMFGAGCTPESSPGCQCKNGYFQNVEGDCVRGNQCVGVQCKPNSTFKLTSCEHTCKTILYSEACIPVTKPTCGCDDGFARNSAMDCVSRDSCKTDTGICPENSSFEEDIKCLNTCENMYGLGHCKPQTAGCQCDDGYYMKKDGTCVKDAECDEVTCKPNSIFTNTSCEHSCKSHLLKGECVQQEGAKCSCVGGYYRNSAGECDTEANCKLDIGVCPENSEYADMPCSKTCRNMFGAECTPESSPGCQCKNGYFQNVEGDCVRGNQCVGVQCKPNSTFKLTSCEHTCKTILYSEACIPVTKPTCACDDGFARNSAMDCVSRESCKTDTGICPENSSFKEDIKCLNTCENMYGLGICKPQTPGCQCDDGYYMKKDGTCVKNLDCDEVVCEKNAVFKFDQNRCEPTCRNFLAEQTCTSEPKRGCMCKDGYYRDNGVCISAEECSAKEVEICPVNSVYRKHPRIQTCEDMFGKITYSGEAGCECIEGYFLNPKGVCIPAASCKNVDCPANTIFRKTSCTLTCKNHLLGEKCTKTSTPACACQAGFYLHSNGKCVSREECVTDGDVCDANSLFKEKPCSMTCRNMFTGATCTLGTRPGCQCNDGLFLNKDRLCVAANKCDSVKCPKNALFDPCSAGNKKTCENLYLKKDETEPKCIPDCVCVEGYVETSGGTCVLPQRCPEAEIKCPNNLKFDKCGNRFHRVCGGEFDVIDKRATCIRGCYCDKDTVYDDQINTCVAPSKCTNSLQNIACRSIDPLMIFEACREGPPPTCPNVARAASSWPKCRPGCYCADHYVLNAHHRCVHVDHC